jgi:hypothetical protein
MRKSKNGIYSFLLHHLVIFPSNDDSNRNGKKHKKERVHCDLHVVMMRWGMGSNLHPAT